jgi:ABC-type antimicrobial peptide transport system permease subunit
VADPLQLNKFKKEMKSIGLLQKSPTADYNYQGISLTVRDSTFRFLGNQLLQSIDTLQSFLPLVGITIVCIGYITSFLLINTRQKEFALMRAIGVGRGMCFRLFLLEQLLIILVGEILGGGIAFLLFQSSVTVAIAGSIFFISYLSGCMFALWRMGRTSVINALFSME